jgi:hypothetical protein
MNTRDLIIQAFNGESGEKQEAMLKACEDTVIEYALTDISDLLKAFGEIDQGKLDGKAKEKFTNIYAKLKAIYIIGVCMYDDINIEQSQGFEYKRELSTGFIKSISPNGKGACQISMWSGTDKIELDSKRLVTETTC